MGGWAGEMLWQLRPQADTQSLVSALETAAHAPGLPPEAGPECWPQDLDPGLVL